MTKAQQSKMAVILAKMETLQREVTDREVKEAIDAAKNRLMRVA